MFRCLIFGTDGLYNMLSPQMAVHIVQQAEKHNEDAALCDALSKIWINPSKCLVERALKMWSTTKMRADNTSVVTLMLDPPGPPRAQVLRNRKKAYPDSGLQIVTRYQNEPQEQHKNNLQPSERLPNTIPEHNPQILQPITSYRTAAPIIDELGKEIGGTSSSFNMDNHKGKPSVLKPRSSLSFDPNSSTTWPSPTSKPVEMTNNETKNLASYLKSNETEESSTKSKEERCSNCKKTPTTDTEISSSEVCSSSMLIPDSSEENIQINEISSSSNELEDEEIASLEPENFTKINFRRSKSRNSIHRIVKKPDKLEINGKQRRKRCISEPSETDNVKKARNSAPNSNIEAIKHDLRARKVSTIENIAKKNEEMVNQVDSTNKELRKMRKCNTDLKIVHSNIAKAMQTRFSSRKSIRKSQRLKSKPKLGKLVNKFKKSKRNITKASKKILLLQKRSSSKQSSNSNKPNNPQQQKEAVIISSNKSPSKSRILKQSALFSSSSSSSNSSRKGSKKSNIKNQKSKQVVVIVVEIVVRKVILRIKSRNKCL
ncbi:hypothetical protein AMK59_5317 [Oryctes borbonicus]|uniref:PPM-type phosphatase domain-containing protein n=1 Tax=Oryctes borbonicus TaxID=1629725 RepID=A0A0T6B4F1_9SCAR|nr:hypothetical protein AMK59_5317 [Oryctes borbonicus]